MNMKKILVILVLVGIISSCSEDFLNKYPEDSLSFGTYFKSPTEIKTGLLACYKRAQSVYNQNDLPLIIELMADDGKNLEWNSVWHIFNKTNNNSQSAIWNNNYKMILNCNNIIDVVDKFKPKDAAEEAVIKAYKGEACFLRALGYFNLVRIYGDVPKVVEPFEDPKLAFGVGRTPVSNIYSEVIIPDLEFAAANCYKKGDAALKNEEARATQGAALTILGKVHLTLKDYTNAEAALKKLIVDKSAGNYSLLGNFSNVFQPNNKFNSESVFEINYNVAAGQPSSWFRWMGWDIQKALGTEAHNQLLVEHNLMREFMKDNDKVRYIATIDSGKVPGATPWIQAWVRKLSPGPDVIKTYAKTGTDNNYMVTRYADALLMYAEALYFLSRPDEAIIYFNQVRTRTGMPALTSAQLNLDAILHERRVELAFEGHRYFDLVRTGKAIEVISNKLMTKIDLDDKIYINAPIPEYQLFLPLPVTEIEKDPTLAQNPGY